MMLVWIVLFGNFTNIWMTFRKVFEKVYFAVVRDKLFCAGVFCLLPSLSLSLRHPTTKWNMRSFTCEHLYDVINSLKIKSEWIVSKSKLNTLVFWRRYAKLYTIYRRLRNLDNIVYTICLNFVHYGVGWKGNTVGYHMCERGAN